MPIDNCSDRSGSETLSEPPNVRVEVLPPRTTTKHRLLDTGTIARLKGKYLRRSLFRVFESIDCGKA